MTTGSLVAALFVVVLVFYVGSLVGYAFGGLHLGRQLLDAAKDHPEDWAALERITFRAKVKMEKQRS